MLFFGKDALLLGAVNNLAIKPSREDPSFAPAGKASSPSLGCAETWRDKILVSDVETQMLKHKP